ncbi:MAG: membrane protein insertase YidC [Alphaproteobacteria bacterium]|nr:membrane protein insertase YidC [Alphaproteobacteria bacterium]
MNNNLVTAIILSVAIMLGFQYFYVKPQQDYARSHAIAQQVEKEGKIAAPESANATLRDRAVILPEAARVKLDTPELSGSIDLKGAQFDDLLLNKYRETPDPASPAIVLLSPSGSAPPHKAFYASFSWLGSAGVAVPTADTLWSADGKTLTPDHAVKLSWDNKQGLLFERTIAVDKDSMFTITDRVANTGKTPVTLYPYGVVARQGLPAAEARSVVHEGGLGVLGGTLEEYKYKKLAEDGKQVNESTGGWLGITDKYWLVAMVPPQDEKITAEFAYNAEGASNPDMGFYQSDFRGAAMNIAPASSVEQTTHLFAGAKQVKLLDFYADKYDIPHFDKAIDFGWFYFLTKPFLYLLTKLANALGSIGIAILVFTVLLRCATLPLSLKSFHSMARMKALQPQMKEIQERFPDDKMRQSQETMELYRREKVNPLSGCFPTLIQIPIFFALYKVLYVNIEMRHAPFFGWIHDMSAPDPTSVLNLFGLLHFPAPLFFHIGAWPILMGCSMFMQQRLSPQPPDKSQARVFMVMPFVFTYMLAAMPAGLVIYWTWSNLLGIGQQWFIMSRDAARNGTKVSR